MRPVHGDLVQAIVKLDINNRTMLNTIHCLIPDFDFRDLKKSSILNNETTLLLSLQFQRDLEPRKNDFLFINSDFYLSQTFNTWTVWLTLRQASSFRLVILSVNARLR